MSKLILVLIAAFSILPPALLAQSGTDPLHWTAPVKITSDNIFLTYYQPNPSGTSASSHQKIFKYVLGSSSILSRNGRLASTEDHVSPVDTVNYNESVDAASGYLTGSTFENVVEAWEGPGNSIQVTIPHFDSTADAWSTSSEMTVPGPATGRIYVRTGDFLGNGHDQFVLAYAGRDSSIHLEVYSVDDSLDPHLIASINNVRWSGLYPIRQFSVTTGDLNGNGKDEIVLAYRTENNSGSGVLNAEVYEVDNNSIQPEASREIIQESNVYSNLQNPEFGITAGHFEGDSLDQVALVWAANQGDGSNAYVLTYFLQASHDLSSITFDPSKVDSMYIGTGGNLTDFSIASGDLDNGGRDELVYDLDDQVHVDSTDNSLNITRLANFAALSGGPEDDQLSYDFLAVGDIDQSGDDAVVVEKDIYGNASTQWTEIEAYELTHAMRMDSVIAYVQTDTSASGGPGSYYSAMAIGAFTGANFELGAPQYFRVNNVVQPLVVLNAPPTHFDVFNGKIYDICNAYNSGLNAFNSQYIVQQDSMNTMEVQTHNDVSSAAGVDLSGNVGVTATASAEFLGAGGQLSESVATNFEDKVEGTFGASYSHQTSSGTSKIFTVHVTTDNDDEIFTTTSSYSLWVYPVFDGADPTPVDYINFVSPVTTTGAWETSKDYGASTNYMPEHEVGNILSYPSKNMVLDLGNPDVDSTIIPLNTGLTISTGTSSWTLDYTKYTNSSLSKSWSAGFDIDINLSGPEFASTGDHVHLTTSTATVKSAFELSANFGGLVDSLSEQAGYTVYPYAYRSKEGAIVINYAVDPDAAQPGQPATWWQTEYGHEPDLTFILPWFYDTQKGLAIDGNPRKYETSDIFFSNNSPSPGDTVTITARVRDFSLVPVSTPVTVKFYVGSPDSGGTVITGINGLDSTTTANSIQSRYWEDVSMKWIVPPGLPSYPRIYAVLDPNDKIPEVHKSNNMGFAVLGQESLTGIAQRKAPVIPKSPVLYQSYPNPFNPTAEIQYAVPARSLVTLTVYDILGQRLETLVSGVESAGIHKVAFNGSRYASGVYFYRITVKSLSGNRVSYSKTMKMLELK